MSSVRFTLFIKKAGTCPFSQRAYMFMLLRLPRDAFETKEVDIQNKTKEFLDLNPEGNVPVLIDHSNGNKVVTDSAVIVQYIDDCQKNQSGADLACGYKGDCVTAGAGIFPAFARFMKNKDPAEDKVLRDTLTKELGKLNDYLEKCPTKFLLGDQLTEPDCTILPRLNQIRAAGPKMKDFPIPENYSALKRYMEAVQEEQAWQATCPTDENICQGWAVHM